MWLDTNTSTRKLTAVLLLGMDVRTGVGYEKNLLMKMLKLLGSQEHESVLNQFNINLWP